MTPLTTIDEIYRDIMADIDLEDHQHNKEICEQMQTQTDKCPRCNKERSLSAFFSRKYRSLDRWCQICRDKRCDWQSTYESKPTTNKRKRPVAKDGECSKCFLLWKGNERTCTSCRDREKKRVATKKNERFPTRTTGYQPEIPQPSRHEPSSNQPPRDQPPRDQPPRDQPPIHQGDVIGEFPDLIGPVQQDAEAPGDSNDTDPRDEFVGALNTFLGELNAFREDSFQQ